MDKQKRTRNKRKECSIKRWQKIKLKYLFDNTDQNRVAYILGFDENNNQISTVMIEKGKDGSIFGSLMGNKMQQDQFGNQLTLMKKQHEYNEASANSAQARAYEMWEKTNYAAQIEQMKKAGLSPALMYSQTGAGGGTVSGAQGQGTSQPTDRSIEMKLKGQEMGLQLANLASQIKLNESQANKK